MTSNNKQKSRDKVACMSEEDPPFHSRLKEKSDKKYQGDSKRHFSGTLVQHISTFPPNSNKADLSVRPKDVCSAA